MIQSYFMSILINCCWSNVSLKCPNLSIHFNGLTHLFDNKYFAYPSISYQQFANVNVSNMLIVHCIDGMLAVDECRYADPCPGAPPAFQQRIAEITSLEQETIRWEKARKFKKKSTKDT